MTSYNFIAEINEIQYQMVDVKKNEHAKALKKVKPLRKDFSFTAGSLEGFLA